MLGVVVGAEFGSRVRRVGTRLPVDSIDTTLEFSKQDTFIVIIEDRVIDGTCQLAMRLHPHAAGCPPVTSSKERKLEANLTQM